MSLPVGADDIRGENTALTTAFKNGLQLAYGKLEKNLGKKIDSNHKMGGPGGMAVQLLDAVEEGEKFGKRSLWNLLVPYSHLRPIPPAEIGKAYHVE